MKLKVGLRIKNKAHPEWGSFCILRKYGLGIWEMRGDAGDRVIFEDEANFWEVA